MTWSILYNPTRPLACNERSPWRREMLDRRPTILVADAAVAELGDYLGSSLIRFGDRGVKVLQFHAEEPKTAPEKSLQKRPQKAGGK